MLYSPYLERMSEKYLKVEIVSLAFGKSYLQIPLNELQTIGKRIYNHNLNSSVSITFLMSDKEVLTISNKRINFTKKRIKSIHENLIDYTI